MDCQQPIAMLALTAGGLLVGSHAWGWAYGLWWGGRSGCFGSRHSERSLAIKEILAAGKTRHRQNHTKPKNSECPICLERVENNKEKCGDAGCNERECVAAAATTSAAAEVANNRREEGIVLLQCHHRFHEHCLALWLKQRLVCPLCRCNLVSPSSQSLSRSQSSSSSSSPLSSSSSSSSPVTMNEKLGLALDSCRGLGHIHECGVLHRDFAARNCLVGSDLSAHVSDFGLSVMRKASALDHLQTETQMLPYKSMAPESIQYGIFNEKSDAWMAGVLMWELFTEKKPFSDMSCNGAGSFVCSGGHLDIPKGLHPGVSGLMRRCFSHDLSQRTSISQVVNTLEGIINTI
mmetsp:Transcript_1934/g.3525  ORF Transcript_1934/g.3525 Transcript_1934/m.3525 type:complete len:348 (-) Transcript_1934:383-1426(-)